MSKVFVVEAIHPSDPGVRISAHRTTEGATTRAVQLVNLMLKDCDEEYDESEPALAGDWEGRLEELNESRGPHEVDHGSVEIIEAELED
jgi:hypothetical protein